MIGKFTEKGWAAVGWLVAQVDAIRKVIADYPRLQNKVDRFNGPGVTNAPDALSIGIVQGGKGAAPTAILPKSCVVKIISNASGGGKYNGRIWNVVSADVSASGNLSAATDLGDDPGSNNALVLNLEEIGQSTHDLTSGTTKVTHFIGVIWKVNSDGISVVAINGIDWENCT